MNEQQIDVEVVTPVIKAFEPEPEVEVKVIVNQHENENNIDEFINILVQSNKEYRSEMVERYGIIKNYLSNSNTARYASMLVDGSIAVASSNAAIVVFDYEPSVNVIDPEPIDTLFTCTCKLDAPVLALAALNCNRKPAVTVVVTMFAV